MKFRVLAVALAAMTLPVGLASAQTKPATPAPAAKPAGTPAAAPVVDKSHASYAFGWQLGQELANTGDDSLA